jgi:hypothetical protein
LDIYNTDIGNIFQNSEGFLYNFFSGRSSYYLQNMLRACIELNVTNKDIIGEIASGLLGNGTNTFTDEKQAIAFRKALKVSFNNMMSTFKGKSIKVKPKESKAETLADKIHEVIIDRDGALDVSIDKDPFIKVYSDIMIEYGNLKDTFAKFSKTEKVSDKDKAIFVSDMDAIEEYISCVRTMLDKNDPVVEQVIRVHQDHLSIYNMFMGTSIKISDKKNIYGSDYIDEKHVDIFVLAKVKDRLSGKSNLMKLSKKEAYNKRLDAIAVRSGIADATEAVEAAEASKNEADIETADALVNELEDSDAKAALQSRLKNIYEIVEAIKLLDAAEASMEMADAEAALIAVNALIEGDDKKNLELYAKTGTPEYQRMVNEIARRLGLTSVKFASLEDLIDSIGIPKENLCTHCFDGSSYCHEHDDEIFK